MSGCFITLEGVDGAGKTTQARRLAERLCLAGIDVLQTREPGGTAQGDRVRSLLLGAGALSWTPLSEAFLLSAARHEHVVQRIGPALEAGRWVLCDRFADSTRAYQGLLGGVDGAVLDRLEGAALGSVAPDLTIILDLDPAETAVRLLERSDNNSFDERARAHHRRLRDAFLAIAAGAPERCVVVDASPDADTVADAIWSHVEDRVLSGQQD